MKPKTNTGLTLIELMIVIAVLSIIASIAFPIYTSYVTKTRRVAAMAELLEITQRMENNYIRSTGAPTYAPAGFSAGDLASAHFSGISDSKAEDYYDITIQSAGPTGYVIQATIKSDFTDDKCGSTLTINQTGQRTITNSGVPGCAW